MRARLSLVLTLALLASIWIAGAVPIGPTGLQVLGSGSRPFSNVSDQTVEAQGGNVTQLNIDALSVTKAWQGYLGNITGNIRLDDANNQSFYAWGNTTPAGEVYATRTDTIDWTGVNCSNATVRTAEETYLGQAVNDGDSVTNTFNSTTHPAFLVGSVNIAQDSCFSTNIFINGSAQTDTFHQILLADNSSNIIYTTIIDADTYGYNEQLVDFQLMVGENEHVGNEGVTTYYFFVELS